MDTKVSEAELALMERLWEASPVALTAAEVAEGVSERGWTLATVKTMLSRLRDKGAVSAEADGRRFLYSPAIERARYVGSESRRMVERLFGGKLSPMIARLAEEDALSDEDLAEIEALVRELRK